MFHKIRLTNFAKMVIAVFFCVIGVTSMIIINVTKTVNASYAVYKNPGVGMSTVMASCMEADDGSSISLLKTNLVGTVNDKYAAKSSKKLGKEIVSTSEVTMVYSDTDGENVIGEMEQYSSATLLSVEEGGWCQLTSGNVTGYVESSNLAFGADAEKISDKTTRTVATIQVEELSLRSEPSIDSDRLAIVTPAMQYDVVEEDDGSGWTEINVENVGNGYVSTGYIVVEEAERVAVSSTEAEAAKTAIASGVERAETLKQLEEEQIAAAAEAQAEAEAAAAEAAAAQAESDRIAAEQAQAQAEAEAAAAEAAAQAAREAESTAYYETYAQSTYTDTSSYVDDYSSIRQSLVNYALSFCGWLPYVWGGSSLSSGADCSGFTMAVYAAYGYTLSHDVNTQQCQGYSVPLSSILPGDIVCYYGHVAIYVGNNTIVHSPRPGKTVCTLNLDYDTIYDVRRIIG